jgi:hypothetical protein
VLKKHKGAYMAIFKCNKTGNTVEFKQQHDIDQMRKHEGYTEVVVTPIVKKPTVKKLKTED